ncbi:putative manganese-dependent inorganic diphosphatase [Clostridium hydrogeniformans]|uniref:putative manganese-dependent inorganic diphosphatase n=1 Tax=Clostridium hydrogeniformans TaxID=349933 RepID=UPI000488AF61|nr:putative manganese-dependent inorganic diphosphatase [Clostridium hydrogeniformans]
MKNIVYVTGHKNPDSDSICASIAYTELKNKLGIKAVASRLGKINRETQFVLDYFGVEAPLLIETVKQQVSDLDIDNIAPISKDITLKKAWSLMKKNNVKTLPVVDENETLIGIVSVSNLTSNYMDVWDNDILSKSNTSLENLIETLSGKAIYLNEKNSNCEGKIIVSAMQPESIKTIAEKGDIAICGDREDAQEMLIKAGASCLVITGGHSLSDAIINMAEKNGCSLVSTPYDSFTASRLITQSIPVGYVMTKDNLVYFSEDDFVDELKDVMLETRYRSYPVVDANHKVVGCVSRYHLISKNKKKVILLDHNERGQSVHGLEDAEILEIIDHHRIADIQTGNAIYFRNEPLGSTSTIVANIFFENGIRPSRQAAGVLCAAIISDTLLFRSPTCTSIDKMIATRLAKIADIDLEKFAKEMFKASTSLSDRTVDQLLYQDFKVFNINGMKIGVAQVNTMDLESFDSKREDMIKLMENKVKEENFNFIGFMLTDILNEGTEMFVAGPDKEVVARTYDKELKNNSMYLPGVLSRKKQVIPPITATISNTK